MKLDFGFHQRVRISVDCDPFTAFGMLAYLQSFIGRIRKKFQFFWIFLAGEFDVEGKRGIKDVDLCQFSHFLGHVGHEFAEHLPGPGE